MSVQDITQQWREGAMQKARGAMTRDQKIVKWIEMLRDRMFLETIEIGPWQFKEAYYHGPNDYEWLNAYKELAKGQVYGGPGKTVFLRTKVELPRIGGEVKALLNLVVGGDALLKINGEIYHGLDPFHSEVWLNAEQFGQAVYELEIETSCKHEIIPDEVYSIKCSQLVLIDSSVESIYWAFRTAFDVADSSQVTVEYRDYVFTKIESAMKCCDLYETDPVEFKKCALSAAQILQKELRSDNPPVSAGKLGLIAQSHLDIVFLWPYKEYIRKIARTHATQLKMLEEFDEFYFAQSQALTYKEMKRYYPDLYGKVRQKVASGKWEPVGAMFIEPDCNLISGESLVRQILYGKEFFEKEFGDCSAICWLPDNFGMPYTLPQILVKSGLKYFLTHKHAVWNTENPWKHHLFWWEGIDGSRIFSHIPSTHFVGSAEPRHMLLSWKNFEQKTHSGYTMYAYGWGDGGGGPDRQMFQTIRNMKNFAMMPELRIRTAGRFFDELYAETAIEKLPIWNDELYLETHRGTYTTKGRLKKYNRRAEFLLRWIEIFGTWAQSRGFDFDTQLIHTLWEDVLTLQFHDTVTGSHTRQVYEDVLSDYGKIFDRLEKMQKEIANFLTAGLDLSGHGQKIVIFNSQPFARTQVIKMQINLVGESFFVEDSNSNRMPVQVISQNQSGKEILFTASNVPACGLKVFTIVPGKCEYSSKLRICNRLIENDRVKCQFDDDGCIVSLLDRTAKRQLIPFGQKANEMQLFEDIPGRYDAWDIVASYKDKRFDLVSPESIKVVEAGPLRSSIEIRRKIGNSLMVQKVLLEDGSSRIDFDTFVDWKEEHKLLKTAFPVDLHSRQATYDIPYGNITRPTHATTSYDAAKFEVPLQKWMDLSEPDYGVSILNDCKYGGDTRQNVMRLSLLRSPKYPDPLSDIEEHRFTYSLFVHCGTWQQGNTLRESLMLNDPLFIYCAEKNGASEHGLSEDSLFSFQNENVTLECFKPAQDGRGCIIRCVENGGIREKIAISFQATLLKVFETSLVEQDICEFSHEPGMLAFEMQPYEIKTFRILFEAQ